MPIKLKSGPLSEAVQRRIKKAGLDAEKTVSKVLPLAKPTGVAEGHDFLLANGKKVEVKSVNKLGVALHLQEGKSGYLEWRNNTAHHVILVQNNLLHFLDAEKVREGIRRLKLTGATGPYKFDLNEINIGVRKKKVQDLKNKDGIKFLNDYFKTSVAEYRE